MGVFCKKSGPFLNAGCIMYSVSIFYFTFYLFGGGAGTHPTHPPPCAYGPVIDAASGIQYRSNSLRDER